MLNRGKQSLSIDLRTEEGRQIILDLTKHFDIIVENFSAGTMDKLGLSYETLKKYNPKIILASINGFGSSGPYSNRLAIDCIAQAMGGLMSQTGMKNGPPLKTGPAVADTVAGIYLALGILSALLERNKTGVGQRLEVSMMDAVFTLLEESVIRTSMEGSPLPIRGNTDPIGVPWDTFLTKDNRWVMVCCMDGDKFSEIYRFIGREDIAKEFEGDDIESYKKRADNNEYLNSIFAKWTNTISAKELIDFCMKKGIPAGEVLSVKELIENEHLKERNMIVNWHHPKLGDIALPNMPIRFFHNKFIGLTNNQPLKEPIIGEHNDEILTSLLNLKEEEIQELYKKGILYKQN